MTLLDDRVVENGVGEIQVLFEEARRRRRRRWIAGLLVLVASVTVVAVLGVDRGPSTNRPATKKSDASGPSVLHARTGATIVYSFNGLMFVNADSGASRSMSDPAPPGGASDDSVIRIGDSLLLNKGDRAWLYRPGLSGAPVDLGPSLRIIPGPSANRVWLWSDPAAQYIRLVDFSGKQIGASIALPAGWFPTGDVVGQGLLIEPVIAPAGSHPANPNDLEVWNPVSRRVILGLGDAQLVAASGNTVAWSSQPCQPNCVLHLTNVRTGVDQVLGLPRGAIAQGVGAYAPDGGTLAVPVELGASIPSSRTATAMVLVDVETHSVSLLSGSVQYPDPEYGTMLATWSRSGWLFFTGLGSKRLLAWHPGDRTASILPNVEIPISQVQLAYNSPSLAAF